MAPTRTKKRKSTESTSSIDVPGFPAPPQLMPTKTRTPTRNPTSRSPIKKSTMGITLSQKQALLDNLQLEITERARKLRAQYMLQAQGLRTRIEIRVNRIPTALRKANMGELLLKYSENVARPSPAKANSSAQLPSPSKVQHTQNYTRTRPSPQRGMKRLSDEILSIDKENEDIENPKKRLRGSPIPPPRTTSKVQSSQVLSPRSANSRTLPRSPVRPVSPAKSLLARPVSPIKPTAPVTTGGTARILSNMVEKAKSGRGPATTRKVVEQTATTGGAGRGRRAMAPTVPPKVGRGRATSDSSDGSTGTQGTIVKKPVVAATAKTAPAKRTVMSTIKSMGVAKKAATAPKTAAPATRVLRKRN